MTIPVTSYILDAIRELYTINADPSVMGIDPVQGLKEKEADLALLTHETLDTEIDGYSEKEALIAATIKDSLTGLLLGTVDIDDLTDLPPDIVFSSFVPYGPLVSSSSAYSEIYVNSDYLLNTEISGGSMDVTQYTYEWIITSAPTDGEVTITEDYNDVTNNIWNIGSKMNFNKAGFYILRLVITNTITPSVQLFGVVTATVV